MSVTQKLENRIRQIPIFEKLRYEASDRKEGMAKLTAAYDPTYKASSIASTADCS